MYPKPYYGKEKKKKKLLLFCRKVVCNLNIAFLLLFVVFTSPFGPYAVVSSNRIWPIMFVHL